MRAGVGGGPAEVAIGSARDPIAPTKREVVGRRAFVDAVGRFLDRSADRPAILSIEGPPGIGKTTVWEAGVADAERRSFLVLAARPAASEMPLALAGFGDIIGPAVDAVADSLPPSQVQVLLAALLRSEDEPPSPDPRSLAVATLSVLRLLSARRPVLIAVDDLMWLDRPTAGILSFALRRLEGEHVGLLATVRTEGDVPQPIEWGRPPLSRRIERHLLDPMSVGAITEILRATWGVVPPRRMLLRIHEASGGNPYFALELTRMLMAEEASSPGEALRMPPTLRGLVAERLGRLPDRVRSLLLAVAMQARPSERVTRRAVSSAERARADLDLAVRAGVLRVSEDAVAFTHPLLAEATVGEATSDARRDMHRALAALATDGEEQARHLALAAEGPDEAVAAMLEAAAELAHRRGVPDAAAELAELSRNLTPSNSRAGWLRRTAMTAEYRAAAFDPDGAVTLLNEAIAGSPPGHDRAELLYRVGVIDRLVAGFESSASALAGALHEAGEDVELRALSACALAETLAHAGDSRQALEHSREAAELAERITDADVLARVLSGAAVVDLILGRGLRRDALLRVERLLRDGQGRRTMPGQIPVAVLVGVIHKDVDEFDEARDALADEYRFRAERGAETHLPVCLWVMAELEVWAGRLGLARRWAEEAFKIARSSDSPSLVSYSQYARALVAAVEGSVSDARSYAEEAIRRASRVDVAPAMYSHATLGFLDVSLGDYASADQRLRPMVAAAQAIGLELTVVRFMPDEIEALIALGELERAAELLDPFEERARSSPGRWARAASARCRGLLLAAHGDLGRAEAALERALDAHEGLSMPLERARSLLVMGEVQRRLKRKRQARSFMDQAREIFQTIGASLWEARARAELDRLGARHVAPSELTPTEERIAALVGAGRTNREVAAAMFLSVRTVEDNVSRIFRKLGVRTRTELSRRLIDGTRGTTSPAGRTLGAPGAVDSTDSSAPSSR